MYYSVYLYKCIYLFIYLFIYSFIYLLGLKLDVGLLVVMI